MEKTGITRLLTGEKSIFKKIRDKKGIEQYSLL